MSGTPSMVAPAERRVWIEENALIVRDETSSQHWYLHVFAPLPDGSQWQIAYGGTQLGTTGAPARAPTFMIDKRVRVAEEVHRVIIGTERENIRVSFSEFVVRHALRLFSARYGFLPEDLPGRLAFDNKLFFQHEYVSAVDAGNAEADAHDQAVRRIPFGKCRIVHGYDVFSVMCTGEDIIYRKGPPEQLRRVPVDIEVSARRSS